MADYCEECFFEMDLCRKCLEQPACPDCDNGQCDSCAMGWSDRHDDDDRDGIAEGMDSVALTLADRKAFLKLPMDQRREILALQADSVADVYEALRSEQE